MCESTAFESGWAPSSSAGSSGPLWTHERGAWKCASSARIVWAAACSASADLGDPVIGERGGRASFFFECGLLGVPTGRACLLARLAA